MIRNLLATAAFLVVLHSPASEARELAILSFDAELSVLPEGVVDVTETIRARFTGAWNGLYRTIPVEYRTARGLNYTLFLGIEKIADESGAPLKYESSRDRHYRKLKIYVSGAEDATKTITIRYRVENALRFFEDHDELYWNLTGDEWDVPIESAAAAIALPPGATGLRAEAFNGAFGARERDADVRIEESEVRVRLERKLGFHEGLTVVAGWDKGLVREPGPVAREWLWLRSNWPFFLPIAVFAGTFRLWYTRGRDPRRNPISARYEPPEGMTPAEVGALADNKADLRDVTATLVDLAVRGYVTIEEQEEPGLLNIWSGKSWTFRSKKELKSGLKSGLGAS